MGWGVGRERIENERGREGGEHRESDADVMSTEHLRDNLRAVISALLF